MPNPNAFNWGFMPEFSQPKDYPFEFEIKPAIEAVLYIASRVQHPSIYHVLKILYFADRKHLEQYGRLICGDYYVPMKDGPVASHVYDLLKDARRGMAGYGFAIREASDTKNLPVVVTLRDPNLDELSKSDLICLDESIQENATQSFGQLRAKSHDAAWNAADPDHISLENLVLGMEEPSALLSYLRNPHP